MLLVLKVRPAEASFLSIRLAFIGIPGRAFGAWMSDALGRRRAGTVLSLLAIFAPTQPAPVKISARQAAMPRSRRCGI
jgi:hypothetical protein